MSRAIDIPPRPGTAPPALPVQHGGRQREPADRLRRPPARQRRRLRCCPPRRAPPTRPTTTTRTPDYRHQGPASTDRGQDPSSGHLRDVGEGDAYVRAPPSGRGDVVVQRAALVTRTSSCAVVRGPASSV